MSQKDLSQQFERGKATIERWYHRRYQIENKEPSNKLCPTVHGIDEHFFNRKEIGALGGTRTPDTLVRSLVLVF